MSEGLAHTTTDRRRRHRRHANPFTVRGPIAVPVWGEVFGREAPLALDVGCGPGLFVQALSTARPELNVLGLEIRPHLVAAAQTLVAELPHAHAILANATVHLAALLPARSVALVSLNFPDPWFKKRHHKRRVLDAAWLAALLPKLLPGAELHVMTDYAPLAQAMLQALTETPALRSLHPHSTYAPHSTTGLPSEREILHMRRGEPIYRLAYTHEIGDPPRPINSGGSRRAVLDSAR